MSPMTPMERIETAIRLGKPDRVPVIPIIDFFAARYGGITQHDMFFDLAKADLALEKTLRDLGPIDGQNLTYAGLGRIMQVIFPTPPQLPGVGDVPPDGQFQFVERSVMDSEEYRRMAESDPLRLLMENITKYHEEFRGPLGMVRAFRIIISDTLKMRESIKRWLRKGVVSTVAYNITFTPMEYISLFLRSLNDFVLDIFRHPEELKAAARALMKPMIMQGMLMIGLSGVKAVFLGGNRTSATFLNPRQFEEFALPEWLEMSEHFARRGITVFLHLDSDWTPFFTYLKDFPRGRCVLCLDGSSDIFKAKEVLGDHMCIMGDVPASLLKLGEPEEVDAYCHRLITEIGTDGGFILSSGCTIPPDAKPENVKAMLQSVH